MEKQSHFAIRRLQRRGSPQDEMVVFCGLKPDCRGTLKVKGRDIPRSQKAPGYILFGQFKL